MARQYVFVRVRKQDYEKLVREKKIPMEQSLRKITGKPILIKNTQLFNIAANSVWDLGTNHEQKILKAIKLKKGVLKL